MPVWVKMSMHRCVWLLSVLCASAAAALRSAVWSEQRMTQTCRQAALFILMLRQLACSFERLWKPVQSEDHEQSCRQQRAHFLHLRQCPKTFRVCCVLTLSL